MHLALFDVFDQIKTEDPTVVVYRSEPSLVTIEYKGKTSESGEVVSQTTVDVVSNKRRLYVRRDGEIVPSGDDTVFLGVMETLAEGSIFPEDAAPSWNAGRTTLAALDNRRSFTVLKPNSRDTIDELPISAVSARAMHRELDQGYWIVAPEMPENAALEDHVWWRIQPETGNALGMIHTGQGASAVQTAILRMVIFSVAYLLIVKPICSNAFSGTAATVCAKLGIGGTAVGTVAATTEGTALGVNAVRFAAFNWAVAAVLIFAIAGLSYLLYADSEIRQKNVISIEDRFAKRHLGDYRNRSS